MKVIPGPYVREPGWLERLAKRIHTSWDEPFDWGHNDCLLWASKCIEAQSGVHPMLPVKGKYFSPLTAAKTLKKLKAATTEDLADRLWGPRKHISQARMGDIVATSLGSSRNLGLSFGVCYGRNSYFTGTREDDSGLVRLDTLTLEHCYQPWASSSKL